MNLRLTVTAAIATAAASATLSQLIFGVAWFAAGIGAIIVIAAAGSATRMRTVRPVPVPLCLLASLVALLLYLNVVYAARLSFLLLFPTRASLTHLWRLASAGMSATQQFAPLVPARPGILLLATSGIGLVAALTDLIAVRLRRCALAGLPLLVLFSIPIASGVSRDTFGDVVLFCIGMAGYLALLSAEGRERLRLWGRIVSPWGSQRDDAADHLGSGPSMRALAASGRRVGLAAVVLALFVPLLLPSLHAHKILPGKGDGKGSGGHGGSSLSPLVQMTNELRKARPALVLTYHTTASDPADLQVYVLGNLSSTSWTMTPATQNFVYLNDGRLPPVPGLSSSHWPVVTTKVAIRGGSLPAGDYLPAPYPARHLRAPGTWVANRATLMLYSAGSTHLDDYTVTGYDVTPTHQQFTRSPPVGKSMASYLYVPRSYRSLLPLARRIAGKASTPFAAAGDLEQFFRSSGGFTYSLNVSLPAGAAGVKEFLERTRSGYCQQFAFAMAVLARLLGIPSRVVVGYTPGTRLRDGSWAVKTSDAHAWPELYFQGLGWLPWEPTPSGGAVGQGTARVPPYALPQGGAGGGGSPDVPRAPNFGGSSSNRGGRLHSLLRSGGGGGAPAGTAGAGTAGGGQATTLPAVLIALGTLLAAALATPRVLRSVIRRRRWMSARDDKGRAHAAWAEVLDDLADLGMTHGPGETPRAVAGRVGSRLRLSGQGRQALLRLAHAEERASYAREPVSGQGLAADVTQVRGAARAAAPRAARWKARLAPASAVERARRGASLGLDALGRLQDTVLRVRNRPGRARAAGST